MSGYVCRLLRERRGHADQQRRLQCPFDVEVQTRLKEGPKTDGASSVSHTLRTNLTVFTIHSVILFFFLSLF